MRLASSLQTSLITSLLLLGGCGSVEIGSPEPTPGNPPAPTQPTPPTQPPILPPTPGISCGLGDTKDPSRVVLAWARGARLEFIRADGSSFVARTFPVLEPDGVSNAMVTRIVARGDFVAATYSSYLDGKVLSEAVLLDRSGEVLWSEVRSEAFNGLYLGDGGALALGFGTSDVSTIVVGPGGKIGEAPGVSPISAPTPGGRVAVQQSVSVYAPPVFGWLDPASGAVGPFAYPIKDSYPVTLEGGVAYLTPDQGGSMFVSEGDSVTSFPLKSEYPSLGAAARHGFLVIQEQWGEPEGPKWRAQPGSPPAPITSLGKLTTFGRMFYDGMHAGDLGEVLAPKRDEHRGGLYRSVDLGATWELVGPSFAEISDIPFVQRGGTYVLQATNEPGYFPMDLWEPTAAGAPAPDRIGPANMVIRPADGIARELPVTAQGFVLSEEGGCLAYQDGGHLIAGDVATGTTVDLGDGMEAWMTPITWLP